MSMTIVMGGWIYKRGLYSTYSIYCNEYAIEYCDYKGIPHKPANEFPG